MALKHSGVLVPVVEGRVGPGHQDQWSMPQLVAVAASHALRAAGFRNDLCRDVLIFLAAQADAALDREFAKGKIHLAIEDGGVRRKLVEPITRHDHKTYWLAPITINVAAIRSHLNDEVTRLSSGAVKGSLPGSTRTTVRRLRSF
jgi:hypothetical protein